MFSITEDNSNKYLRDGKLEITILSSQGIGLMKLPLQTSRIHGSRDGTELHALGRFVNRCRN
jgi:hypothetical protein